MGKIVTIPERHIANARSRTKICLYDTDDLTYIGERTKDHNIHDRFDCLCVFEAESLAASRLFGQDSVEYRRVYSMYTYNLYFFNDQTLAQEMASLGLVTSIDRVTFGKSLIKHLFQM